MATINPVKTQTITDVAGISQQIASTKHGTANYGLPLYSGDIPEWLTLWNNAMNAIDALMKATESLSQDHTIDREKTYLTMNFSVTNTNSSTRSRPSLNVNIIE